MDQLKALINGILALPIIAPLKQLLESRRFMTAVIAFFVFIVTLKDPQLAQYSSYIQGFLVIAWLVLTGAFTWENVASTTNSLPTPDDAKAEILTELKDFLTALVTSVIAGAGSAGSQTPGTSTTVSGAVTTTVTSTPDLSIAGGAHLDG